MVSREGGEKRKEERKKERRGRKKEGGGGGEGRKERKHTRDAALIARDTQQSLQLTA